MLDMSAEDAAIITAVLAFVASEVLPRIQSVKGNSLSEVLLNLLASRCIRGEQRPAETTVQL